MIWGVNWLLFEGVGVGVVLVIVVLGIMKFLLLKWK